MTFALSLLLWGTSVQRHSTGSASCRAPIICRTESTHRSCEGGGR